MLLVEMSLLTESVQQIMQIFTLNKELYLITFLNPIIK